MTTKLEFSEKIIPSDAHPLDYLLRHDRLPHVWCSGCGLGSILNCFLNGINASNLNIDDVAVVSGIGCTGRASGYINADSFHTTHGRAIPFAIGLKLACPDSFVSVISGDGDLFAIGGNHIIHAARRNIDLLVICVNNFNYGMTGGQGGPTTPFEAWTTTTPHGNIEPSFNLVDLMASSGASYVARWTSGQVRRITESFKEAISLKGFRFIEIISPCPTTYGRRNRYREGIQMLKMFQHRTIIAHNTDTTEVSLPRIGVLSNDDPDLRIQVGKFIDRANEKKSYLERVNELWKKVRK